MIASSLLHGFFIGSILVLVAFVVYMLWMIAVDALRDFWNFQSHAKDTLPADQKTDATPDQD